MLHFAPPCATWSRARIPRLRTEGRWIEGVPLLKMAAQRQLELGTQLARATVLLVREAIAAGVGFSIENPLTSLLFRWPPMQEIMSMPGIYVVDLDYCRYGTPWRKPTRLLTDVASLITSRLRCLSNHVHQELRGRAPNGELVSDCLPLPTSAVRCVCGACLGCRSRSLASLQRPVEAVPFGASGPSSPRGSLAGPNALEDYDDGPLGRFRAHQHPGGASGL